MRSILRDGAPKYNKQAADRYQLLPRDHGSWNVLTLLIVLPEPVGHAGRPGVNKLCARGFDAIVKRIV